MDFTLKNLIDAVGQAGNNTLRTFNILADANNQTRDDVLGVPSAPSPENVIAANNLPKAYGGNGITRPPVNSNGLSGADSIARNIVAFGSQLSEQEAQRRAQQEEANKLGAQLYDKDTTENAYYQNVQSKFPDLGQVLQTFRNYQVQNQNGVYNSTGTAVDDDTLMTDAVSQVLKSKGYNLDPAAAEEYVAQYKNQLKNIETYRLSKERINDLNAQQKQNIDNRNKTGLTYTSTPLTEEQQKAWDTNNTAWQDVMLSEYPQYQSQPRANQSAESNDTGQQAIANAVNKEEPKQESTSSSGSENPFFNDSRFPNLKEAYEYMDSLRDNKNSQSNPTVPMLGDFNKFTDHYHRAALHYINNTPGLANLAPQFKTSDSHVVEDIANLLRQANQWENKHAGVLNAQRDLDAVTQANAILEASGLRPDVTSANEAQRNLGNALSDINNAARYEYNGQRVGAYNPVSDYSAIPQATPNTSGSQYISRFTDINPQTYSFASAVNNPNTVPASGTGGAGSAWSNNPPAGGGAQTISQAVPPSYYVPQGQTLEEGVADMINNPTQMAQVQRGLQENLRRAKENIYSEIPAGLNEQDAYRYIKSSSKEDKIADLVEDLTGADKKTYIDKFNNGEGDHLTYEELTSNISKAVNDVRRIARTQSKDGKGISESVAFLLVKMYASSSNFGKDITKENSLPVNFAKDALANVGNLDSFKENVARLLTIRDLEEQQAKSYDALVQGLNGYKTNVINYSSLDAATQRLRKPTLVRQLQNAGALYGNYVRDTKELSSFLH